ncbi:MAG: type II toxin-antitoxin system PemK/MazF family toxin [bacterium]
MGIGDIYTIVLVFQLRAIDKKRLKRKIGQLDTAHLAQLYVHVKALLQFP